MPDSGYQIPDHGIARAAQALAPHVALSFYKLFVYHFIHFNS